MNLTELSAELESRADDLNTGAAMARLAGVRGRVRARRRRRAGALAVLAAGCVVAVLLTPNLIAPPTRHSAPSTVSDHQPKPYTFDTLLAGDPLIASAIGRKGQNEVVLRFTPSDTNISVSAFCALSSDSSTLWGATTVNGHTFLGGGCENSDVANGVSGDAGDGSAAANRAGWAERGVVPGRESVIRIRLQTHKGAPRTDPSVRLGIGIYLLSGDRVTAHGVTLKLDAESDGHDYRMVQYLIVPARKHMPALSLQIPAGRKLVLIAGGSWGDLSKADSGRSTTLLVDGKEEDGSDGGIVQNQTAPDNRAHTLTLKTSITTGQLVLAYYEQVD